MYDLLERWQQVKYLPMHFGSRTIDNTSQGRLTP
jgi:hypothetical protein